MNVALESLEKAPRLLFEIPLIPLQGARFQPTGFPSLGAAQYETKSGNSVLVESAQSMANRLESVCWDEATQQLVAELQGLSHVTVTRGGEFFTDTVLEAHRLNSPYLLEGNDKSFVEELKKALGGLADGPIDRRKLAKTLFQYDVGSLLHGVFLAKKELAGGRLRIPRAISAFIEADGAKVAPSGGVKNDHVNPRGATKQGYGNVPFARDEYTADRIVLFVNVDLALIRGYGLDKNQENLLTVLALYKLAALVERGLRLRTACDLEPEMPGEIVARRPQGFRLPDLEVLKEEVKGAINACRAQMSHTTVTYEDVLKKGKDDLSDAPEDDDSTNEGAAED